MDGCPKAFKLFKNKQWQQCYERFLLKVYGRCESAGTVRTYQYILRDFFANLPLAPGQKSRSPDSATQQEVEDYLRKARKRDGKPPSPYTYNHKLGVLQSFYGFASTYMVPFRKSKRPLFRDVSPTNGAKPLTTHQVDRTLTEEQMHQLLAVIPRDTLRGLRDRAIVLFYFWTGRRKAEIIRLLWRDLEFKNNQWIYHFKGKGHRSRDDKDVLDPHAKAALDEYLRADGRLDTMQPDDPLFLPMRWRHEVKAMAPTSVDKILYKYWQAAGIDGSCHWFRHTHAYELYKATNKDLVKVSRRLRHSSIEHTRRYLEAAEVPEAAENALLAKRFGDL